MLNEKFTDRLNKVVYSSNVYYNIRKSKVKKITLEDENSIKIKNICNMLLSKNK